jgi:hypothetical protein
MTASAIMPSSNLQTPETYLDYQRAAGFAQQPKQGIITYGAPRNLSLNEFALNGTWKVGSESITPVGSSASVSGGVQAQHVYLVMTSSGNVPRSVHVLLDGRPLPNSVAGADVHNGAVTVRGQRLYSLVSFPADQQAVVTVQVPPGVSAYDFTFG